MTWLSQLFGFFQAFQIWVIIAPWESGLRIRLGKVSRVLNPGPHWRIPFLDRIFVQAVRLRTIMDSGQTITTKDGKILTLSVVVSYAIGDIQKLYETVSNPEATLLWQIQGRVAEFVVNNNADEITPSRLEEEVRSKTPSSEWGLTSVNIVVTTFAFVKVYRLMNFYDNRSMSKANELEESK